MHAHEASLRGPTYAQAERAPNTPPSNKYLEVQGHTRAATSLREYMEEMLTLYRLGVPAPLRDSLKTINIIGSVNSMIVHRTRNVKRETLEQYRWMAIICILIENQPTPIPN